MDSCLRGPVEGGMVEDAPKSIVERLLLFLGGGAKVEFGFRYRGLEPLGQLHLNLCYH